MEHSTSIMTITPYENHGIWAFDDEARGLVGESFVAGASELINDIVKDIPNAHEYGFLLTFSATPFPGFDRVLVWVDEPMKVITGHDGVEFKLPPNAVGNTYQDTLTGMKGWLCPALYAFFGEAPKQIFIKADELHEPVERVRPIRTFPLLRRTVDGEDEPWPPTQYPHPSWPHALPPSQIEGLVDEEDIGC